MERSGKTQLVYNSESVSVSCLIYLALTTHTQVGKSDTCFLASDWNCLSSFEINVWRKLYWTFKSYATRMCHGWKKRSLKRSLGIHKTDIKYIFKVFLHSYSKSGNNKNIFGVTDDCLWESTQQTLVLNGSHVVQICSTLEVISCAVMWKASSLVCSCIHFSDRLADTWIIDKPLSVILFQPLMHITYY